MTTTRTTASRLFTGDRLIQGRRVITIGYVIKRSESITVGDARREVTLRLDEEVTIKR